MSKPTCKCSVGSALFKRRVPAGVYLKDTFKYTCIFNQHKTETPDNKLVSDWSILAELVLKYWITSVSFQQIHLKTKDYLPHA
jgi:hypothetical protein